MEKPNRFNLRVYGLLRNQQGEILVAHESIGDFHFSKFPGGGLEFGEGPEDCLIREFQEETGLEVSVHSHLYTTGFFQPSAFNPLDQLVSIYYWVGSRHTGMVPLTRLEVASNHFIRFEWVASEQLHDGLLTFPVDRHVARLVKEKGF